MAAMLAGCTAPADPGTAGTGASTGDDISSPSELADTSQEYTAHSWRQLIADSCHNFYDGCNQCRRMPGASEAACTRRACFRYEKPRCLDPEPNPDNVISFRCGDRTLDMYRHHYAVGHQTGNLAGDQIALREHNIEPVTVMTRTESASGEKYAGGNMQFWIKGNEAMWLVDNTSRGCVRQ